MQRSLPYRYYCTELRAYYFYCLGAIQMIVKVLAIGRDNTDLLPRRTKRDTEYVVYKH